MEYGAGDRAEAFRTAGVSKAALLELIDGFEDEVTGILSAGTGAHLGATVEFIANDNLPVPPRNGAGTLFAAIGHPPEHVGHVKLMHDLWLSEHRSEGR
jgi:hypothetical protein